MSTFLTQISIEVMTTTILLSTSSATTPTHCDISKFHCRALDCNQLAMAAHMGEYH